MSEVLKNLATVLEQRKHAASDSSYVASLHAGGLHRILQKVGEEATETILAATECAADPQARNAVVHETADLWFHTLVMLSHLGMGPEQVLEELEKRSTMSGLEEKAAREN